MSFAKVDFSNAPYIVLWELTRACALACRHCRARALRKRNDRELRGNELSSLLDQIAEFGKPLLVLTGGDPFERPDLVDIVKEAKRRNLKVALTPSATSLVSESAVKELAEAGLERLAISLDGPDAETHDNFRRVKGSYEHTINILNWARTFELPIQINTSICRYNYSDFERIHERVKELAAVLWSVFFVVPTGRANIEMQISALEAEEIMKTMALMAVSADFDIKATAAPHFRRVLLDTLFPKDNTDASDHRDLSSLHPHLRLGALRSYQSVNDGKGIVFISHTGDVYPSGFLPISAGNVRETKLADIYRHSELFCKLRDPRLLSGKCGRCRFKFICGGSRARAFAETGNYLAEDSLCAYDEALAEPAAVS